VWNVEHLYGVVDFGAGTFWWRWLVNGGSNSTRGEKNEMQGCWKRMVNVPPRCWKRRKKR
jgi:hypothetical protein